MERLAVAKGVRRQELPSGQEVLVPVWTIRFPPASPPKLFAGVLPETYARKPLVDVDGDALFGELAVLRWLQKDGWNGVWVDTFHDRGKGKLFWQKMPVDSEPYDLSGAPKAKDIYNRILEIRGGRAGGFFDVLAWRGDRLAFVEYKGEGDRPNVNELLWIDAALEAGVAPDDMLFVVYG